MDTNNIKDVVRNIEKWAHDQGMEIAEPRVFFDGIDELYRRPSLSQVIGEELPRIVEADPHFFAKYGIDLPENQEAYLFDLYYDKHGRKGMERVCYSAKVWFRHLRFFLVDHHDQDELNNTVDEYKKILDGDYFKEPA